MKKSLLLILALGGMLLTACNPQQTKAQVSSERPSAYDRIIKSGVIRAGYLVYPPACLKDPNTGKLSGVHIETLEKAAAAMGFKVEWQEASGWSTMVEDVRSGKVDFIGSAVWANAGRGKVADFAMPLYWSGVCAYVRTDDHRFDGDLSKINDSSIRIATIDGEMAEMIAKADYSKATPVSLPQNSELSLSLENVASGKADVTFAEPLFANLYLKSNPGKLRNITPNKPLRVFPNSMLLPKGDSALKNMLDTALAEQVNSGAVDLLIAKYVSEPGGVFPNALPYRPQH